MALKKTTMEQERIEIKLSKTKGMLAFLGSLGLVATSIWLIAYAGTHEIFNMGFLKLDPRVIIVVGYVGLFFFGICGLYIFYKLFDNEPGLVINNDGIYDNSSAAAGHLIKWERVTGLRIENVMSTKFILIDIENPEQFMDEAGGVKKKLLWGTYKMYGTPTSIASTALSCNFDELFTIIDQRLKARPAKSS
jgi:hypothetical protein